MEIDFEVTEGFVTLRDRELPAGFYTHVMVNRIDLAQLRKNHSNILIHIMRNVAEDYPAFGTIRSYLEEKGVAFKWAPSWDIEMLEFTLIHVSPRFYHEVMVPGLRGLMEHLPVSFKAEWYERDEEGCSFTGVVRYEKAI